MNAWDTAIVSSNGSPTVTWSESYQQLLERRRVALNGEVYAEKLDWFKENEKPEVVLFVGDDPALTKIVLAWTNTAVSRVGKAPLDGCLTTTHQAKG